MASSPLYQARSISLPSRPHPVAEQLDEQLCRLRSSQSVSTSSSSVSEGLNSLRDLYSSVDEFLQLPHTIQIISQVQNTKCVDQVLDGSLRLVDICSASRDALQQSREHLQNIQSALRRRSSGELSITSEATEYLKARRTVKKTIKKCLTSLKQGHEQTEVPATINMLNEVQAVTEDTFKSLLSYIVGSRKSGWSVVGKLIGKNANKNSSTSEFEDVDATLNLLITQKKSAIGSPQMENLMSQALKLESHIQDLDESLECMFRNLVKCRACLLNIFSY